MKYFDWLVDDLSSPNIALIDTEVYKDTVLARMAYIGEMIIDPIQKFYCKRGVERTVIVLPRLFLRLPTCVGVTDEFELKIYEQKEN